MLVKKKGQEEPRLTFNYHYVFKDKLSNHLTKQTAIVPLILGGILVLLTAGNPFWTEPVEERDL